MSKEVKVGILAIVAGVLLYFGFNFLKGNDLFSGVKKYYVKYANVDGLTVSNPVVVNGLSIGRVSAVQLNQQKGYIMVELEIKDDFIVGDTAKAILINSDFLGGKAIELDVGNIDRPKADGDTLEARVNNPFDKVLETTGTVANDIEITISRINEILAGMKGSGEDLAEMIKNTNDFIKSSQLELKRTTYRLDETMIATKETIVELKGAIEKVSPVLDSTSQFMGNLNELNLKATLEKTNSMIDNLNGAIGDLKQDGGTLGKLMSNDSLYNNLNQLLIDIDKLTNHLNEHPKDFFSPLGKKHKKVKKNLN